MKRLPALLIVFGLEALIATLWTSLTPSESGHALFLGLSGARIVLSAFMLLLCLGLLGLTIYFWRFNDRWAAAIRRLDGVCLDQGMLGPLLVTLLIVPLLITAGVLKVVTTPLEFAAYRSWAPDTFPLIHAVVGGILPLLSFLILVAVESAVYLAVRYSRALVAPVTWAWSRIGPSLLLVLIALTTLAHWVILGFQLRFLVAIPAWYWKIETVPLSVLDAWFTLGVVIILALVYWIFILKRRILLGLTCVFLLGWFLQIGVGLMAGAGFDSIRERYFSTYHRAYVLKASQNHASLVEGIQRYEDIYGSHAFTSTKPPGLMAFYVGLDQLINGSPSAYTDAARYERLSQAIVVAFPLLAASMVFLLWAFIRRQLPAAPALVSISACLLYVLGPGVVLFSLFPDQAVYPLVFLLGIWLAVTAVQRRSLVWAFSLGVFLYLAVFFAFTMLPLLPFTGLYLVLYDGQDRSAARWKQRVAMAAAIGAGVLLLWLIFGTFLHYNFIPRFERTMAINHNFDFYLRLGHEPPTAPETPLIRIGQIVNAAWVNSLDFAASVGFPIYLLFAVQAIRLALRLFARRFVAGDTIPVTLLLTFIVLNAAGTAQGEVPRLWLFWLPMVVLMASFELEPYLRRRPSILLWLALAEFVTVVLTFHFQDLRM